LRCDISTVNQWIASAYASYRVEMRSRFYRLSVTICCRQPAGENLACKVDNQIPVAVVGVESSDEIMLAFTKNSSSKVNWYACGVVDPDLNPPMPWPEFGCPAFGSVKQLLSAHSEVRAASVAAPTAHHLASPAG